MPNWKKIIVSGSNASLNSLNVTSGVTGSLLGTASTASYVNTLNQNVLITGSLTIGSSSLGSNENTLALGPPPAGGAGEGGQILLQASGGLYTSASMWDNWQNYTRLLRGTNASSDAVIAQFNMHSKQVTFPAYNGSSAFVGTAVANLAVDSSGNILTVSTSGGTVFPYVGAAVISGSLIVTGSGANTGSITANGPIYSLANGAMYFRGGDDAEFWDINIANHVGIYGQQDQGVASIKLGSGGGIISGRSSSIGIGITTPISGALHVNGGVFANSFTGSFTGSHIGPLTGTASYATTASYANTSTSASYALNSTTSSYALTATSASYSTNSTTASTASFVTTAQTASFYGGSVTSASYASNATSASYAPGGTVNTGTSAKLAYYPSTGDTVDDAANLEYDGTNLKILSTAQLDFYTNAGSIYFGTFGSPTYGRAGFSVPGQAVMVVDYSNARAGFGGGTSLITSAPAGLVEIQGKTDEIQLLVKGNGTQTNNILEIQKSTGAIIYYLDNNGDAKLASGSLGVGIAPNGTDGRIDASNDIVAFSTSDINWKTNIKPIENAIDKVKQISGNTFDWIEDTNPVGKIHGNKGKDIGVIAQEIEKVLPEIVTTRESGTKAVKYEKIVALLIEAIKEQQQQIDELKSKLK